MDVIRINLELSIREATILAKSLRSTNPSQDDEMIVLMLYARIQKKIEEQK
jgi:hypothetical protein